MKHIAQLLMLTVSLLSATPSFAEPIALSNQQLALELQIATSTAVQSQNRVDQYYLFQQIEAGISKLDAGQRVAILETLLTTLDGTRDVVKHDFARACLGVAVVAALTTFLGYKIYKGKARPEVRMISAALSLVVAIGSIAHGADREAQFSRFEGRLSETRLKLLGLIAANRRDLLVDNTPVPAPAL